TLFLDEIGDMPMEQQVALLRVLQERKVTRIGGDREIPVDIRVICATNKNLLREVDRGNFRKDLYYRLNVISVVLPPLRNRPEDIKLYFDYFLNKICHQRGVTIKYVNQAILHYLQEYDWPGNVRELQNVIEKMINLATDHRIDLSQLPEEILTPAASKDVPVKTSVSKPVETVENVRKQHRDSRAGKERDEIIMLLARYGGNISEVAKNMGVCRNTVYRKIKLYNISLK
ncbi:MAG TPA: sigma 54-interacting transcriptional regulator, partial [Syntrophomonadaceae bacterium]|nr:sigma 54-interacting transcriptional regulator [Syntrophomonadaceae bacterium]